MITFTLPSGVTERTTLPCTSLNQSVPSGRQSGPSVNLKPPATFSIAAARATSASSAGSIRSILPTPPPSWQPGHQPQEPPSSRRFLYRRRGEQANKPSVRASFQLHRYTSS